jgi:DNA-binding transcriptional ArsR family regulator
MADVYEALAAPVRRAKLCTRLTVKRGLGLSRQAVSQHLEVLEDAGLVRTRREGRYKFHDLDTGPLREIAERWPIPHDEEKGR